MSEWSGKPQFDTRRSTPPNAQPSGQHSITNLRSPLPDNTNESLCETTPGTTAQGQPKKAAWQSFHAKTLTLTKQPRS